MQLPTLLSLALVATLTHGTAAVCNEAVALETDGGCECIDASLWYNYRDNICQDESSLYPWDGCGQYATNSTGSCTCEDDFENSSSGLCEAVDPCPTSTCLNEAVCYNNEGLAVCKCSDGYQRAYSNPGACVDTNEELNPKWNDCPQTVRNNEGSYLCFCLQMFTMADEGRSCTLKPEYEDCSEENDNGIICVREISTNVELTFEKQGFQKIDNTTAKDINECEERSDTTNCWPNSHCENLDNGQGYECVCDTGYTDELFANDTIKECVPKQCPDGERYDCADPCAVVTCESNEVCVEQSSNIGTCVEELKTAIITKQLPGDLYVATLELWDDAVFATKVTASLEVVFGEGFVQASRTQLKQNQFEVQIVSSDTNLAESLLNYCQPLAMMPEFCAMPMGVIVKITSISPEHKDVCEFSACSPESHECNSTSRTCDCKEDGTGVNYMNSIYEICEVPSDRLGCGETSSVWEPIGITFVVLTVLLAAALIYAVLMARKRN